MRKEKETQTKQITAYLLVVTILLASCWCKDKEGSGKKRGTEFSLRPQNIHTNREHESAPNTAHVFVEV